MKNIFVFIMVLTLCISLQARQTGISGTTTVPGGCTTSFTYYSSSYPSPTSWNLSGGTILSSTANSVTISWGTSTTNGSVVLSSNYQVVEVLYVTIVLPPVIASATNITSSSFVANWGSVSGATSYQLDVSTTSNFSSGVTTYTRTSTSYTVPAIAGTPYYYRVRAVIATGVTGNSSVMSLTTTADPIPQAPVALQASNITSSSFTANWTAVPTATSYYIDVSRNSNFTNNIYTNFSTSATPTHVQFSSLTGSTTFYYRVRAVNQTGSSSYSNTIMVMDKNYIRSTKVLKEGVLTQTAVDNLTNTEQLTTVDIFDGLGRPDQNVNVAGSPSGNDVVQFHQYNQYGQEIKQYLPYTNSTSGVYESNPVTSQLSFYTSQQNVVHDPIPYSEADIEISPLNRTTEQGSVGSTWQISKTNGISNRTGHTLRYEYGTNAASDVYLWTVDEANRIPVALSSKKYYSAGKLMRTRTYDENAPSAGTTNWTEQYKDSRGLVVLKRAYETTGVLNTYYIYDDLGLLRFVIPPATTISLDGSSNSIISASERDLFCYVYKYDARLRMVQKKLPGADSVLMVYDKRDRLVATQDGVQRAKTTKEWSFTKYDALNRSILTGTFASTNTRVAMQNSANTFLGTNLYEKKSTSPTDHYYTNVSFPTMAKVYYTVNYYDENNAGNYIADADFPGNTAFPRLRNQLTTSKVRQLDPASSTEDWYYDTFFYDKHFNLIQTKTTGLTGIMKRVTNSVDFVGKVIKSKEYQEAIQGGTLLINYILSQMNYDPQGRLLSVKQSINNNALDKQLSALSYNELGQLMTKKLHVTGTTGLQKVDYNYNIRGWLKKINEPDLSGGEGDFFGIELLYNEGFSGLTAYLPYNGNISGIKSKNGASGSLKGYGFSYDQVNRLVTSTSGEGTGYTATKNRYDENMTYDKNGNIISITRNGQTSAGIFGNLDVLSYSYTGTGNQVRGIGDNVSDVAGRGDFTDLVDGNSTQEYSYDKNGNMITDLNKNLNFEYNMLNLPQRVINRATPTVKAEYVYTSSGQKLKERFSTGNKTLFYFGNFVYTLDGTANGIVVKHILTPEGLAVYSSGSYTYEYYIKDHLGSIRVAFDVNGSTATVVQQDDYYPFGMRHNPIAISNKYLYNGKEFQDDMNLNWYDYGARFYDPQIGRFHSIDPMAVFTPGISPYSYADDNPISNIDYYGLGPLDWWRKVKDFVMTNILSATKYGSWTAGNVYYRFLNTGSSASPNYTTYGPHEPRAPYAPGPPEGQYELMASDEKIPTSKIEIPDPFDLPIPQFRDKDFPAAISVDLPFEINSFNLDEDKAEKLLSDLIKSLQDYPQLQILIMVNTADGYHVPGKLYGGSKEVLDQPGIRGLMNNRANAIYQFLIRKGINPSQLKYGPGKHFDDPSKRKAVFDRR
jgi:RHS repeat-associated protein